MANESTIHDRVRTLRRAAWVLLDAAGLRPDPPVEEARERIAGSRELWHALGGTAEEWCGIFGDAPLEQCEQALGRMAARLAESATAREHVYVTTFTKHDITQGGRCPRCGHQIVLPDDEADADEFGPGGSR